MNDLLALKCALFLFFEGTKHVSGIVYPLPCEGPDPFILTQPYSIRIVNKDFDVVKAWREVANSGGVLPDKYKFEDDTP